MTELSLRFLLTIMMLAFSTAPADASQGLMGEVVRVVDGDTIVVRIGTRTEIVRYIGMDTPELAHSPKGEQPGGREAAKANEQLVQGQTVRLELDVQERDRYGRLLAYVFVGDLMINAELVSFPPLASVPRRLHACRAALG